jgi:hypothetical protein
LNVVDKPDYRSPKTNILEDAHGSGYKTSPAVTSPEAALIRDLQIELRHEVHESECTRASRDLLQLLD